jgi:virginiamycin B lyase
MVGERRSIGVLVAGIALLLSLVAAGEASAYIYWADGQKGAIGRAENDGSGVDGGFIEAGETALSVAVNSTHVYWANRADGMIGRAKIDGTGVDNDFIAGLVNPSGVALSANSVFWSTLGGEIGRAKLDGSDVQPGFITGPDLTCGIAVDAGHVYWVDDGISNTAFIGRAGLDGKGVDLDFVTIGTAFPCGVAVNSTHVFWSDTGLFAAGSRIGRANIGGVDVDTSLIGEAAGPCGIAIHGSQLYWANLASGTIGRANTDASGVNQSFLATGGEEICGVAIDSLASPAPPQPPAQPPQPSSQPPVGPPAPDSVPPQTTIVKGPGRGLIKGIAKLSFRASEAGSRFECKLDGRKRGRCKSPKTYSGLKPGRHTFKAWAIDAAGNADPTPAKRTFRVP